MKVKIALSLILFFATISNVPAIIADEAPSLDAPREDEKVARLMKTMQSYLYLGGGTGIVHNERVLNKIITRTSKTIVKYSFNYQGKFVNSAKASWDFIVKQPNRTEMEEQGNSDDPITEKGHIISLDLRSYYVFQDHGLTSGAYLQLSKSLGYQSGSLSVDLGGQFSWFGRNVELFAPANIACTKPEGFTTGSTCYHANSIYVTFDADFEAKLGGAYRNGSLLTSGQIMLRFMPKVNYIINSQHKFDTYFGISITSTLRYGRAIIAEDIATILSLGFLWETDERTALDFSGNIKLGRGHHKALDQRMQVQDTVFFVRMGFNYWW